MIPRPGFETEHLYLRPFEPDDLPALEALLNHPDLYGTRYIPWEFPEDLPLSSGQVEAIYKRWSEGEKQVHLAVVLQTSRELVGYSEVEWEWDPHCPFLAIVISPLHRRSGYGSEVLNLLLGYLFGSTPAHNVTGWIPDWNHPGLAFARRNGFQDCGRSRREGLRNGAYYDAVLVDLLRPEWDSHREEAKRGARR
jgi:RimJ/RimL family protein N-acetyltransferase